LKERARAARRWLKARPEKEIVMVTHGGFLHYFTEDWEDSSQFQGVFH
jgi:broad specificity phosphatase PhoE